MLYYIDMDTQQVYAYEDDTHMDDIPVHLLKIRTHQPSSYHVYDGDKWTLDEDGLVRRDQDELESTRLLRDRLLSESDYLVNPDHPMQRNPAVLNYRQSLRDVMSSNNPPASLSMLQQNLPF